MRPWILIIFRVAVIPAALLILPACGRAGEPIPVDPIEWVLQAFDHYNVVALGEGNHTNLQGATFRLLLIRDPRFAEKVNDILVEFGTVRYQSVMDRYISGEMIPMDSVRLCWRETTQPFLWDAPIYAEFFAAVRALNQSLPQEKQLRVLLGDPAIDWSGIHTREELEAWYRKNMAERPWGKVNARDGSAMDVLEREVFSKNRKALAIYGDTHFNKAYIEWGEGFMADYFKGSLAVQLERLHPGSVFTIQAAMDPDTILSRFPEAVSWPRPSMVILKGNRLGAFSMRQTGNIPLEKSFDAFLWLGPSETRGYSRHMPEAVSDERYYNEMLRRDGLWIKQFQKRLTNLREQFLEHRE